MSDCKAEVALAMLHWVYTDQLELSKDDAFLVDLMKLANRFQLHLLRERSDKLLTLFYPDAHTLLLKLNAFGLLEQV